jgi:hypothetical protein
MSWCPHRCCPGCWPHSPLPHPHCCRCALLPASPYPLPALLTKPQPLWRCCLLLLLLVPVALGSAAAAGGCRHGCCGVCHPPRCPEMPQTCGVGSGSLMSAWVSNSIMLTPCSPCLYVHCPYHCSKEHVAGSQHGCHSGRRMLNLQRYSFQPPSFCLSDLFVWQPCNYRAHAQSMASNL